MEDFNIINGAMINLLTPYRILHVIKRLPDFKLKTHSHDFYHIIFITSGILEVTIHKESYTIHENQAIILPPYIPHALSSKYGYSQIGVDILDIRDECPIQQLLIQTFPSGFSIVNMQISPNKVEGLIKDVRDLTTLNLLKLQNSAEALVLSFIEQATDSSNKCFRNRFLDMLTHKDSLNLTLSDMCNELNISKTHLERLANAEFGCSAIEYQNKLKTMKACFLLQNSELSMRSICERLGFYDESHFTRFFKKQMNLTPSQYRNNSRFLL